MPAVTARPAPPVEVVPATGAIGVDGATFWYPCAPPDAATSSGGEAPAVMCRQRIATALADVLREYPESFPQPPPVVTVIRAVPRAQVEAGTTWSSATGSYGCATLENGIVVIEIGPSAFAGRDALDDAELRSLIAHELVHAYQFARGPHEGRPSEIARRELEALDWEIAHLEPEVRPWYREDLDYNRKMYAAILWTDAFGWR